MAPRRTKRYSGGTAAVGYCAALDVWLELVVIEDSSPLGIELAVAPLFGMPPPLCTPLGLAYLNGALRAQGFSPSFRDLAAEMIEADPALHAALFRVAMPEAGGYYGVDLPLLLDTLRPGTWPVAQSLGAQIHEWSARAARAAPIPALCLLHVVDANLYASAAYGQALRQKGAVVVAGGPGVRLAHVRDVLIRVGAIDAAALGEGEAMVAPLARRVLANEGLDGLPGLHTANCSAAAPPLENLHTLPWPSFEGFPLRGVIPMMASRGCIRDCSFCSERFFWSRFRLRRVEDVVAEMQNHWSRHRPRRFFFHDDLMNANPRWLRQLGEAFLALGAPWTWECYMEPARLDEGLAKLLRQSGLEYVRLGVEHLSPSMLARMNRVGGLTAVQRTLAALSEAGIRVFFDLVVGHPGETEADHEANLQGVEALLAERPQVGVSINPFSLLDGAPTGLLPAQYGVSVRRLDPIEVPEAWAHLRPLASQFIVSHVQDPPPEVVKQRAQELEKAIRALGRRTNLTDREAPARALGPQ